MATRILLAVGMSGDFLIGNGHCQLHPLYLKVRMRATFLLIAFSGQLLKFNEMILSNY
jgi:hypothetical protein